MSKFSALAKARQESKDAPVEQTVEQAPTIELLPIVEPPKKGRPPGKRSDPAFEQVTAYVRRDTYRAIKIKLLQEGDDREFSELVESLLVEYLNR
jgi:hypothetical protein